MGLSLHCIDTESPHWDEGQGKAAHAEKLRHPAFYGCFDWHSAVHGHWAMLRAADQVRELPERDAIISALSQHLSTENIAGELASISKIERFETPYGFGWGLRLGEELALSRIPEAAAWREAYAPFEAKLAEELRGYLLKLKEPNRVGMHDNTAFATIHAWDYATTTRRGEFRSFLEERARKLYLADHDCTLANEPGPTDFISPCFVEADLMRRVLSKGEFTDWYGRFLPNVEASQLRPVPPTNPQDYYQVHLVGLMYEKSSAMAGVAEQFLPGDPRRRMLFRAGGGSSEGSGETHVRFRIWRRPLAGLVRHSLLYRRGPMIALIAPIVLFAAVAFAGPATSDRIQVTKVLGPPDVQVKRRSGNQIVHVGDDLIEGDEVTVAERQLVSLAGYDGSLWKLAPGTRFVAEARKSDKATSAYWSFAVTKGAMWGKVTKNIEVKDGFRLKVRTKAAALGIRGTEYVLDGGENHVDVLEGTVWWGTDLNFAAGTYKAITAGSHGEVGEGGHITVIESKGDAAKILHDYRIELAEEAKKTPGTAAECLARGKGWRSENGSSVGECDDK